MSKCVCGWRSGNGPDTDPLYAHGLNDIKTISHRIEHERNLATANRVCRHTYDTIQELRRHPHMGWPGAEEGTRELVISKLPYIVVYC